MGENRIQRFVMLNVAQKQVRTGETVRSTALLLVTSRPVVAAQILFLSCNEGPFITGAALRLVPPLHSVLSVLRSILE